MHKEVKTQYFHGKIWHQLFSLFTLLDLSKIFPAAGCTKSATKFTQIFREIETPNTICAISLTMKHDFLVHTGSSYLTTITIVLLLNLDDFVFWLYF